MSWNGTVYCSHCYEQGHNRRGCPIRKEYIQNNPNSYAARSDAERKRYQRPRRCSYCQQKGHNRRTCTLIPADKEFLKKEMCIARQTIKAEFERIGFGVGALVREDYWEEICLVQSVDWRTIDQRHLPDADGDCHNLRFVAKQVKTGRVHGFGISLQSLPERVLSPTTPSALIFPDGWADGTLYDEQEWFNGQQRHWYMQKNNIISP